jgi:hypothetical protein
MTIAERLELIRAGYTREEIATFEAEPDTPPAPAQEPDTLPAPAQEPETPPAPAQEPDTGNAAVLAAINNLTKAIQMSNLKSANVGADNKLTPEQALAQGVFGNKS